MPQELHVLRCYACGLFQVHIVKKANKWECKVCQEKQSVKQEYGRGSGKDCRLHVQKLNELHGRQDEEAALADYGRQIEPPEREDERGDEPCAEQLSSAGSKWSRFLDEPGERDCDEGVAVEDGYGGGAFGTESTAARRRESSTRQKVSTLSGNGKWGKFMSDAQMDDDYEGVAENLGGYRCDGFEDMSVTSVGGRGSERGRRRGMGGGKWNKRRKTQEVGDDYAGEEAPNDCKFGFGKGLKPAGNENWKNRPRKSDHEVVTNGKWNKFIDVGKEVGLPVDNYDDAPNADECRFQMGSTSGRKAAQNIAEKTETKAVGYGKWGKFLDEPQDVEESDEEDSGGNVVTSKGSQQAKPTQSAAEKMLNVQCGKWDIFLDVPPHQTDDLYCEDFDSSGGSYKKSKLELQKIEAVQSQYAVGSKWDKSGDISDRVRLFETHSNSHYKSTKDLPGKRELSSFGFDSHTGFEKQIDSHNHAQSGISVGSNGKLMRDDDDLDEILKL